MWHGCVRCSWSQCRYNSCPICFPNRHKHNRHGYPFEVKPRHLRKYIFPKEKSETLPKYIIEELEKLKEDINSKRTEWTNRINRLLTNK